MKAVYAGSFDPITLGHVSVIERAFNLFDEVHIIIANNRAKSHYFTLQQRTELVRLSIPAEYNTRAHIVPFEGIVANYINEHKIDVVIREFAMRLIWTMSSNWSNLFVIQQKPIRFIYRRTHLTCKLAVHWFGCFSSPISIRLPLTI